MSYSGTEIFESIVLWAVIGAAIIGMSIAVIFLVCVLITCILSACGYKMDHIILFKCCSRREYTRGEYTRIDDQISVNDDENIISRIV